jgi:hypothetical protein
LWSAATIPLLLAFSPHPEPGVFKYNFATETHTFARGTKPDRINGGVASTKPFYFSVPVPKGTFKVSVFTGDPNAACRTTIKVGSRVMVEQADTEPARTREVSFEIKIIDAKVPLTLEFGGTRPCLDALEIRPVP